MDCSGQPLLPITEDDIYEYEEWSPSVHPMITVTVEVSLDEARKICTSLCMNMTDISDKFSLRRVVYYNDKVMIYDVMAENLTLGQDDLETGQMVHIYGYYQSNISPYDNMTKGFFSCERRYEEPISNLENYRYLENEDEEIDTMERSLETLQKGVLQLFNYEIEYGNHTISIIPNYLTYQEAKSICSLRRNGRLFQPMDKNDSELLESLLVESKVSFTKII